jgi:hypothetical protein
MTVSAPLHMPSLGGGGRVTQLRATEPAELRGHVVLVDLWTLTCINWLRTKRSPLH